MGLHRLTFDVARKLVSTVLQLLGYRQTDNRGLLTLRVILNVAAVTTGALWFLSTTHVILADIGNNAKALRGIGFFSSPKGIAVCLIDRASITNSVEVIDVTASPSRWDWDAMQQPFDNKWTFFGLSVWFRTRQCFMMVAAKYSTVLVLLMCGIVLLEWTTKRCVVGQRTQDG
ncbi:MAG: hypothetical protein JNL58_00650 [Planctomyces sp.]|nr:hypothetical protein [Planctomyces sp.]